MLSRIYSAGTFGIDGYEVTVECSARDRLGDFQLVGLPDTAVKEAVERVKCACENSGYMFPAMDIMVNLAPANIKKEGSSYDLAILASIMQCDGVIPRSVSFEDKCLLGELSLSGELRKISGVLCMTLAAKEMGRKEIFVPTENASEASVVEGVTVYGVENFKQLVAHLKGEETLTPTTNDKNKFFAEYGKFDVDFSDVRGQYKAKRALEIAAAGGHNVLMIGPPGAGKSMLSKRIPTILPSLTFEEALETTKIHSVTGNLKSNLVKTRPFRSPHHTVTAIGLVGGGQNPKPGEISIAHNGVLFLDELPEFPKQATESLRQPLEDGVVTVTRAMAMVTYPASFMLVCAMNPCKCGYFGDPTKQCSCTPQMRKKYLDRVSGPLLDRIDIEIELPSVSYDEISGKTEPGEPSKAIRERVNAARRFSRERLLAGGEKNVVPNAKLTPKMIRKYCALDKEGEALMRDAFESLGLSARGHDRVLRVARTIADLDGEANITADHVAEAIMYRTLDRKYWKK